MKSDIEKFINFYRSFGIELKISKHHGEVVDLVTNKKKNGYLELDVVRFGGRAPLMRVNSDGFISRIYFDENGKIIKNDIFG